jgi:hypothetical protein
MKAVVTVLRAHGIQNIMNLNGPQNGLDMRIRSTLTRMEKDLLHDMEGDIGNAVSDDIGKKGRENIVVRLTTKMIERVRDDVIIVMMILLEVFLLWLNTPPTIMIKILIDQDIIPRGRDLIVIGRRGRQEDDIIAHDRMESIEMRNMTRTGS